MTRFLLVVSFVCACPLLALASPPLDSLFDSYATYRGFSGVVLVADHDRILFEKAYGLAHVEFALPNRLDTRFSIASVTKVFTACMTLHCAELGLLELDAPVARYLPGYRKDTGRRITVAQLLAHTSGLPNFAGKAFWEGADSRLDYTRQEFVTRFCSGDLLFPPGSAAMYSDANYFLLGLIIEAVTGLTCEQALRNYILDPVGMENTGTITRQAIIPRLATGYLRSRSALRRPPPLNYEDTQLGAGDMYSTIGDLYLFTRGLETGTILGSEAREEMFKPRMAGGFEGMSYAYGWNVGPQTFDDVGRSLDVAHAPGNNAGFATVIYRIGRGDYYILISENTGPPYLDMMLYTMAEQATRILQGWSWEPARLRMSDTLSAVLKTAGLTKARAVFELLKDKSQVSLDEGGMNRLGYALMSAGDLSAATFIFEVNTQSFPNSSNVWDSFAECCEARADSVAATRFYRKALELDPNNDHAQKRLSALSAAVAPRR